MENRVIHLHVHSEYSILDGCGKQDRFVRKAKKDGATAIAFTEHGSIRGVREAHRTCSEHGVKPIFGFEAYVVTDRFTKELPIEERDRITSETSTDRHREEFYKAEIRLGIRPRYHVTLIAENDDGLQSLFRLSSLGWTEGFAFKRPRIDFSLLAEHSDGVICLSGCPMGPIARELGEGNARGALRMLDRLLSIFGPEHFYLEIMPHDIPGLAGTNAGLVKISKKRGLKLVATQDAHYAFAEDAFSHDALLSINTKSTLFSPKRFRFTGKHYWLKTEGEMKRGFACQGFDPHDVEDAIESTDEIGERAVAAFRPDPFKALLPAIAIDPDLTREFEAWRRT